MLGRYILRQEEWQFNNAFFSFPEDICFKHGSLWVTNQTASSKSSGETEITRLTNTP